MHHGLFQTHYRPQLDDEDRMDEDGDGYEGEGHEPMDEGELDENQIGRPPSARWTPEQLQALEDFVHQEDATGPTILPVIGLARRAIVGLGPEVLGDRTLRALEKKVRLIRQGAMKNGEEEE
jgi:hypothetical protein